MKPAVIIPARNEADCIGEVVREVLAYVQAPVVVVDNGSTDATAAVARAAGAIVVAEPTPGYGRACAAGVRAAPPGCDVLVFMDGDGSDCPSSIPALLAALEGGAALALAVRHGPGVEPGSIAPAARFGNWLSGRLIGLLWGRRLHDLSPLKAVRRDALDAVDPREQTYGWTVELLARTAKARRPIVEVESGYRKRRAGQSKVSGNARASVVAGYRILGTIAVVALDSRLVGLGLGALAGAGVTAGFAAWLMLQGESGPKAWAAPWLALGPLTLAGAGVGVAVSRLRR